MLTSSELMNIKYNIFILILWSVGFTVSCTHPQPDPEAFGRAEALMDTAPDSALSIISGIDRNSLPDESQQARYSLLMSMALDKNGVDTVSFDILQPAIDYYLKHGTPDDILRTRYYQGRIFQNAGLRDSALHCFTRAIATAPQIHDSLCLARAFVAQAHIFKELYELNNYINNHLKALEIYRNLSKDKLVFDCYLNILDGAKLLDNKNLSDSVITILDNLNIQDDDLKQSLQSYKLSYTLQFGTNEDIKKIINNYDTIIWDVNGILNLALAYNHLCESYRGLEVLDFVNSTGEDYDTLKYQAIRVTILKDLGNYKEALGEYEKYSNRLDSINRIKFILITNTIKDKHAIEIKAEKEALRQSQIIWRCVVGLIVLTTGILLLLMIVRSNRIKKALVLEKIKTKELENAKLKSEQQRLAFEAENLSYRVESLEEESNALKNIIANQNELPTDVQKVIQTRIEMLNSLLASHITADDKYGLLYDKWVNDLIDNIDEFMNTNRMAFQVSHPHFIQYFEEQGLTVDEINYVCLYALGLKGKDVGNYIKKPSHVNMSSAIRKKLGLDKHETNLGNYVRNLLKNL